MSIARKVKSAAVMLRRKGLADAADLARLRAGEFYLAHRPLPSDAASRARLLATTLNRRSLVSAVAVEAAEVAGLRGDVLAPYLRHRFAEAAAAALHLDALRAVEVAMLADALLTLWDFPGIAARTAGWGIVTAGTPFALRVAETGRRAALRLGRLAEAVRGIEGEAARPELGSLVLRGDVYDALGRMDEARAAYEAAIRRDGTDPDARQAYGFHLMKAGRIRDGLASWSVADALFGTYPLRRHRPHWTGEPLGHRRLMVLFEHGLGDMLQMARFLPRLRAQAPDAVLMGRVPAPLAALMRRSFPDVAFVTEDEREPGYDLFVPSMQLPAVLDAPDLEPRTRYIALGRSPRGAGRPRVGVCWRGHPRQYEATRSIPLDLFAKLFAARGVDFVVLLNRLTEDEAARLAGFGNVEVPAINDFVDLAALVGSCDLVVSVDTAVVHLAGAGGAPALLLSRPDACWRWGAAGETGPWYESVTVLRHGGDMEWPRLLARAAESIGALCPAAADP